MFTFFFRRPFSWQGWKRVVGFSSNSGLCLFALLVLLPPAASAQPARGPSEWISLAAEPPAKAGAARWVRPDREKFFRLNPALARARYAAAPKAEPASAKFAGTEVELPMPDGTLARFVVVEAPVMAPELAAKFPEIKTYAGQGIDDPQATVRLDLTPLGFHAQVLSPRGAVYVDPAYRGDPEHHVSYYKRDYAKDFDDWQCLILARESSGGSGTDTANAGALANKVQSGGTLRTYRLAVACTGEYAAYFGGTAVNAMSAIVTAVNRVDGVYETELAVRLVLVANNNLIVYTSSTGDPYSNNNGSLMLDQNQSNLDSEIGSANYDIGHVFSTGGGGVAIRGCVCEAGYKAQGVTGSPAPTGDPFWIDYVAHEMGHQFGANHTFNSENGSCGGGNRNDTTAYEPGSGLTIMAYAGICSPDNLQPNSDPFFHGISLDEIQAYVAGTSCAVSTATTNNAPTVSAGANYTIPASTPFVLTAAGSDPDGDALTYGWEQMDLGAASALTGLDNGASPLFRPFRPTNSPARHFPKLSSILANTNWNQEVLPTTSRTLHFRVTARDNRAGGGGVADAQMTVTTIAVAGPFVITAPNTAVNWSGPRTVTWNVAGTTNAPISASGVNIFLSTNSGQAFQFLLATNVPNTGSALVVMPNVNSTRARIKVQATGNIFFDINNVDFTVAPGSPTPLIQLTGTSLAAESCTPPNGAVDPYETVTVNWTLSNFGNAPTTNLVATLLATNGVYYPGGPQNYGAIAAGGSVTRPFQFVPAGNCGGAVTGMVQLADGAMNMGTVSQVFSLGTVQTTVVTQIFNSATAITIRDNKTASPYPSTIPVSGVSAVATKVVATINGWSHTWPADVSILLAGPGGQSVKLAGGAGGGNSINNITVSFDDDAGSSLTAGAITAGVFVPTDLAATDTLASPAPSSPYGTTLAALTATPNGTWSLYVEDFNVQDLGSISNGWSLKFITATATTNCCSTFPQPTMTSTTYSNNVVRFVWTALPGPHYQVQYRTNLTAGSWQNLGPLVLGTNTLMSFTDTNTNAPARFYRVQVLP